MQGSIVLPVAALDLYSRGVLALNHVHLFGRLLQLEDQRECLDLARLSTFDEQTWKPRALYAALDALSGLNVIEYKLGAQHDSLSVAIAYQIKPSSEWNR